MAWLPRNRICKLVAAGPAMVERTRRRSPGIYSRRGDRVTFARRSSYTQSWRFEAGAGLEVCQF